MDDVPVKIVERYKPPPSVYQLPQTIVNKLQQYSEKYYHEQPDYQYDFQLERSVLSKAQRWRQQRQQQQQDRQARQERRKQERQRAIEAQQKEMLGAVEYPSAAELSSDSEEEEVEQVAATTTARSISGAESHDNGKGKDNNSGDDGDIGNKQSAVIVEPKSINSCNFNTILQPTVLSATTATTTLHKRNSSLNYADFEYNMNSTPFDNIELKTINDLDILAQVLHNTQLKAQMQKEEREEESLAVSEQPPADLTVTTLAETKAALDSVNFHSHCDDGVKIIPVSGETQPQATPNSNSYATPALYQTSTAPYHAAAAAPNYAQQSHTYHVGYNQQYYQPSLMQQQQQLYNNQNYYINGYGTPTHQPLTLAANVAAAEADAALKSKSVPDILRELKTELLQQQAEQRRARNHSHNAEQAATTPLLPQPCNFNELAAPAQKLARRISSMGFPLERVAKVVSLCGIDDKKIIEHLIPLSELLDLGFDETKISAALLKFDNNKDKALDYLIN